jgi:hypothetical protein
MIPRTPREKIFTQGYQRRPSPEGTFTVDTVISCISERAKKMSLHMHRDVYEFLIHWKTKGKRRKNYPFRQMGKSVVTAKESSWEVILYYLYVPSYIFYMYHIHIWYIFYEYTTLSEYILYIHLKYIHIYKKRVFLLLFFCQWFSFDFSSFEITVTRGSVTIVGVWICE